MDANLHCKRVIPVLDIDIRQFTATLVLLA